MWSKLDHTKSSFCKGLLYFRRKKTLKQCQKEVIYEYILAFAGWWSIFWMFVGGDGYILAGGRAFIQALLSTAIFP